MIWGGILRWLTGGGLGGIAAELRRAHADKLAAQTSEAKIDADLRIAALEADVAAHREAVALRLATAGQWEMRVVVFTAGFFPSLHFAAVCADSLNWFDMPVVDRLPTPMDEWQGAIILSLFGLSVVKLGATAFARRR